MTKFRVIFQKNKTQTQLRVRSKTLARRTAYEVLAAAAKLRCILRHAREIFDSGLNLPEQIRAFYKFHVYFTVRRILFQMGGVQSKSALLGDSPFNVSNNPYDIASYKKICAEFGIDPSSDFRFTSGKKQWTWKRVHLARP